MRCRVPAPQAVGVNVNLAFTVPKEGAERDLHIAARFPQGAPHPEAAYQFINFMLRPDVIAEITNAIYYGNDNLASRPLVNPRILTDVTLYPTPAIEARLLQIRRGDRRDRTHSHPHLDAGEDRQMTDDIAKPHRSVSFTRMEDGTREDYELLERARARLSARACRTGFSPRCARSRSASADIP